MIELSGMDPLTERYRIPRRLPERAVRDFNVGRDDGHGWPASAGPDGRGTL